MSTFSESFSDLAALALLANTSHDREHFASCVLDTPAQCHNLIGDIIQGEELLRVNFAISYEIGIDMHQHARPDLQLTVVSTNN